MKYDVSLSRAMKHGLPPESSYWVGADRETLRAQVDARRHVQAVPTEEWVTFDPMIAATAELMAHKVRARLARRKKGR